PSFHAGGNLTDDDLIGAFVHELSGIGDDGVAIIHPASNPNGDKVLGASDRPFVGIDQFAWLISWRHAGVGYCQGVEVVCLYRHGQGLMIEGKTLDNAAAIEATA